MSNASRTIATPAILRAREGGRVTATYQFLRSRSSLACYYKVGARVLHICPSKHPRWVDGMLTTTRSTGTTSGGSHHRCDGANEPVPRVHSCALRGTPADATRSARNRSLVTCQPHRDFLVCLLCGHVWSWCEPGWRGGGLPPHAHAPALHGSLAPARRAMFAWLGVAWRLSCTPKQATCLSNGCT